MSHDIDYVKVGDYLVHVRKFFLHPTFWEDTTKHFGVPLNWKAIKFSNRTLKNVPNSPGIYCFVVIPKVPNFFKTQYLFYVGQTTRTLLIRYSEYLDEQAGIRKSRRKVKDMLTLYKNNLYFFYTPISNTVHIDELEEKLLNTFVPHINTSIPEAKINDELKYIYEQG